METTRVNQGYNRAAALYMAIDTGAGKWVLLFSPGDQRQREVTVVAGDRLSVEAQITGAKARFALPADAPVFSCYEAGRDGFWIHRWLQSIGVDNRVVHPASIEVPQRAKRVKTDRVDVRKLLAMLLHVCAGEKHVWKELKVPTPEQEDHRRLHRERERLLKERNSLGFRIGSLLATQGVRVTLGAGFQQQLQAAHCWNGQPLPPQLIAEIERMWIRRQMACEQLRALERKRCQDLVDPQNATAAPMRQLMRLCGVGVNTAWILCSEIFAWREIANRRQLGALAGITRSLDATPSASIPCSAWTDQPPIDHHPAQTRRHK